MDNHDHQMPVEELRLGDIDTKPIDKEWDTDAYLDDEWTFWAVTDVELTLDIRNAEGDTVGDEIREVQVVIEGPGRVLRAVDDNGVIIDIEDYDNYVEDNTGEDGEPVAGSLTGDQLVELAEIYDIDGDRGPKMNYFYPVDTISDRSEAADAAMAIRHLPLCVVEIGDDYGFALTGGGMDLSWEIAEAYVNIGCLPPVHFADLPAMAGKENDPAAPYVLAAMLRSLDVAAGWMTRRRARLIETFQTLVPSGTSTK